MNNVMRAITFLVLLLSVLMILAAPVTEPLDRGYQMIAIMAIIFFAVVAITFAIFRKFRDKDLQRRSKVSRLRVDYEANT